MQVQSLGWEDPLEEDMKTASVFLPGESQIPWRGACQATVHRVTQSEATYHGTAWRVPRLWSGKESGCQCRRYKRLGWEDRWVGKITWSRKWQPTPVLLPGKFHGAWLATVHQVANSWT